MIDKIDLSVFNYKPPNYLIPEGQLGNKLSFQYLNIKGHFYPDSSNARVLGSLSGFINEGKNSYPLLPLKEVSDAFTYLCDCLLIDPYETNLKSLEAALDLETTEKIDLSRLSLPIQKKYKLFESDKKEQNINFKLNKNEDLKIYCNGYWNARPEGLRTELEIRGKALPVKKLSSWQASTSGHLRNKLEVILDKLIISDPLLETNSQSVKSLDQLRKRDHLIFISRLSEPDFNTYLAILPLSTRQKREIKKSRLEFLKQNEAFISFDIKQLLINKIHSL
jgi:hypothetical protein